MDEPPLIIEPTNTSRPCTRSERPLSSVSDIHPSMSLYSASSTSRIGDLPTRLSGIRSVPPLLISHNPLLSLSPTSALLQRRKPPSAAKHGKGRLDMVVRYLLDSDSTPDKCTEPIWLLGVQHPGYEVPPLPPPPRNTPRRSSIDTRRYNSPPSFRSSSSSSNSSSSSPDHTSALSQSQPSPSTKHTGSSWPPAFYADFTSRIWLTYRSQFQPIRDTTLAALESESVDVSFQGYSSPPVVKRWNWGGSGEKMWMTDSGWGCMLRTGQSLLANALLHLHLGRGMSSEFLCSFFLSSCGSIPRLASAAIPIAHCGLCDICTYLDVVSRYTITSCAV